MEDSCQHRYRTDRVRIGNRDSHLAWNSAAPIAHRAVAAIAARCGISTTPLRRESVLQMVRTWQPWELGSSTEYTGPKRITVITSRSWRLFLSLGAETPMELLSFFLLTVGSMCLHADATGAWLLSKNGQFTSFVDSILTCVKFRTQTDGLRHIKPGLPFWKDWCHE